MCCTSAGEDVKLRWLALMAASGVQVPPPAGGRGNSLLIKGRKLVIIYSSSLIMPAPCNISNWSLYKLLEVSSVNYLFVLNNLKYIYPVLDALCPDTSKKDKLTVFYNHFSTLNSIHTCLNFEYVKHHDFKWTAKLYFKVNTMKSCNSPSMKDVFQFCQKGSKNFRILLEQLIDQYSCLDLETNYDRTEKLSILCSFYQKIVQLQEKGHKNIVKWMALPFTWSDIQRYNQESYLSNVRRLRPVVTIKERTTPASVGKILQKPLVQAQPSDCTEIKCRKKWINGKHSVPLNGQTEDDSQECKAAKRHQQQILKKMRKNTAVDLSSKIAVNKQKRHIQYDVDRYVSQLCTLNKALLLKINNKQTNSKNDNDDDEMIDIISIHDDSSDEDISLMIKKYENLTKTSSDTLMEKDVKIKQLENNIKKCRNKCKRLHNNLNSVKRLHLKQKSIASNFI